ncbi:MAG: WYL domain-containing transcriptional regulator [Rhodanobacteraceae bacterium]
MRETSGQTLARQWAMLRAIPRTPYAMTAAELAERLRDEGYHTSRRTIERDLHILSARFPLTLDDRSKPYGWSWMKDASFECTPRLTPSQSVALLLARTHLRSLLPQNLHKDLLPVFEAAERAVAYSGWKDWHRRTAVVPVALPLLPPKIAPSVLTTVQMALARKHCIEGRYRAKGSAAAKRMRIHPLGLIVRGPVLYLACTLFDYDDVRQLALHRLTDVTESDEPRRETAGFDFAAYAQGEGVRLHSRGSIRLVVRFAEAAAEHLRETPLSKDQTWRPIESGARVEVTATVEDDDRLRWWLLAFGSQVEVCKPAALRRALRQDLLEAIANYRRKV